ncbi:hypothetical protein Pmani_032324 [Petrolisthes manimaculis]|uniref:Ubiquinone biosynthesis protein n=1 Tax=Petrolisthes manimaculis TaxID=1843537 RepID=A0AAE1NT99_9EUCA|nr:hypothetical protein Pmani_032324 [Petrolisthes manimaculis]
MNMVSLRSGSSLLTRIITTYRFAGCTCGIRTSSSPLWSVNHGDGPTNTHNNNKQQQQQQQQQPQYENNNNKQQQQRQYEETDNQQTNKASDDSDSSGSSGGSTSEGDTYIDTEEGEYEVRQQILDAALPFVHSYGWTQESIVQGAESLGYSGMAHGMFPGGGVELVNFFYKQCNKKLEDSLTHKAEEINNDPQLKKGTTTLISEAVEERLRMNIEYMTCWHKALALHASPLNTIQALDNMGSLVDIIWYHAGDRCHDFNWYTKRGLLAAVYKSSELCMLQDKSDDFQDTWDFMHRRLSDVHNVGKCFREVDGVLQNASAVVKAGIITGLNIIGLNNKTR